MGRGGGGGGGGGGSVYANFFIQTYEIHIEAEADFSEAIWCGLKTQGSKILVGGYIVAHQLVRLHEVITHVSRDECDFNQPDI